jgi:small subunit ribosomal protein S16
LGDLTAAEKLHGPKFTGGWSVRPSNIESGLRNNCNTHHRITATGNSASQTRPPKMVVKIRLARFGRTNSPFYNIIVAHARYVAPLFTLPALRPTVPPSLPFSSLPLTLTRSRTARNNRPLEVIGTYDPIPKTDPYDDSGRLHKDIKLDTVRAKYWIGVGAQPTDTVWRLLSMVGTPTTHGGHEQPSANQ